MPITAFPWARQTYKHKQKHRSRLKLSVSEDLSKMSKLTEYHSIPCVKPDKWPNPRRSWDTLTTNLELKKYITQALATNLRHCVTQRQTSAIFWHQCSVDVSRFPTLPAHRCLYGIPEIDHRMRDCGGDSEERHQIWDRKHGAMSGR